MIDPSGSTHGDSEQPTEVTISAGDAAAARLDTVIRDPDARIDLHHIYEGHQNFDKDVANRVRQVRNTYDNYTWPFIKSALRYMKFSGLPVDQMAFKFNVSLATMFRWLDRMKQEWREDAVNFDAYEMVGRALEFKTMIIEQAMQQAATSKGKDKLAYMRLAAQASNDQAMLVNMAGGWADEPLSQASLRTTKAINAPKQATGLDTIKGMIAAFRQGPVQGNAAPAVDDAEVTSTTPPRPPSQAGIRPVRSRRRTATRGEPQVSNSGTTSRPDAELDEGVNRDDTP